MARPSNDKAPETAHAVELTAGRIARLTCRTDRKAQAFLRDTKAPGLRVRVSNTGHKSFVFETKLRGRTVRRSIGDVRAWTIEQAREEARRLAVLIDEGTDPAELERQKEAEREAAQAATAAEAVTVGEAWARYVEARRPYWSALHLRDNVRLMAAGGEPKKRGKGLTVAGPLHQFAPLRLVDLDAASVETWAREEGKRRPTAARLALRLLRAFLTWCHERPEFSALVPDVNPARNKRAREALGKPQAKHDALQREQLAAWFAAVRAIPNATASAYLQALLLTGARPNELLGLRWEGVNWQWKGLTIHDKAEGERVIPLTPYVAHLLAGLPRRNDWAFASPTLDKPTSRPHRLHVQACKAAGIDGLTLHGLRRSFGTLSEWLELPAGVVAQIMGHKPSAIAEKHYRVRPLDLLRVHHERLEAWILEQAGVQFDASKAPGMLRVVAGAAGGAQ